MFLHAATREGGQCNTRLSPNFFPPGYKRGDRGYNNRNRNSTTTTTNDIMLLTMRRCASIAARRRKKVVVTNGAFDETYEHLQRHVDVVRNESTEPWTRKELINHAHDAHAILAFMTDSCDRAMLDACPNLELVACALKGFDNFDIDLCAERGVAAAVPDLLTEPTAELAILLALALGRRLLEGNEKVRSGAFKGWRPTLYGSGLSGSMVEKVH